MLLNYGLFLAKAITVVVAVALIVVVVVIGIAVTARRNKDGAALAVTRLNDRFDELAAALREKAWSKDRLKQDAKARKKALKAKKKNDDDEQKPCVYVLTFKGDMRASAVSSLREEVSAIVAMAESGDEVLLRLENPGGVVFDHGLASSQLQRIKDKGIALTVAVDKVAASGGYMMACVADRIIAAPFAVLGSIGVLAQVPNFHRLLKDNGVDFEQFKGGRFKRTVTMFGHNSDEDREKFQEEIDEIHTLFRNFVAEHRPALDMDKVATGEHWFGRDALDLKLCDELGTSDDWLMARRDDAELLALSYKRRRSFSERLAKSIEDAPARALTRTLSEMWAQRFWR